MSDVSCKRLRALVFFSLMVFLVGCLIYAAFLHTGFQLDDQPNFSGLSFVHDFDSALKYIFDGPAGLRWLSYASYLPHSEAWRQGNAFPFKLINLLIHIGNAFLVFLVLRAFFKLYRANKAPTSYCASEATSQYLNTDSPKQDAATMRSMTETPHNTDAATTCSMTETPHNTDAATARSMTETPHNTDAATARSMTESSYCTSEAPTSSYCASEATSQYLNIASVLALLCASLWFVLPVHVNTVLYAVQRMTLLAGSFCLVGLLYHLHFCQNLINSQGTLSIKRWFLYSANLAILTVLGVLGKENAVLLPAFCLLLACYTGSLKHFKRWQWLLTYIAPFILLLAYLFYAHRLGYGSRNFTMDERLLSQVVIIKDYLIKLLLPNTFSFSLYYDGFAPVRSVFDSRFILAVIFWFSLFTLAFALRKSAPVLLFGLLWFLIGHSLEGSIIPLELYFDHRNYFPAIGIVVAVVVLSAQLLCFLSGQGKRLISILITLTMALLLANLLWVTYFEASIWRDKATFEKTQMLMRPNSLRAKQGYIETLFAQGRMAEAAVLLDQINQHYGVQATHLMFEVLAICAMGNSDKINYPHVLRDLAKTPFDMGADEALKSIFNIVIEDNTTCPSLDLPMFRQWTRALLSNPNMRRHYHNFAWLLVQSYLQRQQYQEALDASMILDESLRSQQYWFLQLRLAIFLKEKKTAQALFDAMQHSKQVYFRIYHDEIQGFQQSINELDKAAK